MQPNRKNQLQIQPSLKTLLADRQTYKGAKKQTNKQTDTNTKKQLNER